MQSDPSTDWSKTLANNNARFHNVQKNSSNRTTKLHTCVCVFVGIFEHVVEKGTQGIQ